MRLSEILVVSGHCNHQLRCRHSEKTKKWLPPNLSSKQGPINPSKSTQLSISGMQTFSINFRRMVIDKQVYERKNTFELGRGSWLSHPRSTCGHSCHTRTTENDLALALIF